MAVALRDSTQFTVQSDGTATLTLPTGTAAGDVLVCWCEDGGRSSNRPADTSGWYSSAHRFGACWWRVVTAADVTAGSVALLGEVTGLVSVTGCRGIGTRRDGRGITVSETGAAVLVTGFRPPPATTVDPSGSRLDSVVEHEDWPHSWWLVTGGTAGQFLGLSGTNDDASYYSWELLPKMGPEAPTLVAPLAGAQADVAEVTTLSWIHNSTSGLAQDACKVRIRVVGAGSWSYVLSDGTLSGTETTLTQAATSATIDASTLSSGSLYEWAVATQDESTWSDWSASQQFRAVAAPVVDDIGVAASAGDLSPLLTVAWTMGYGAVAAWQVRITPSASGASDEGTVYDSGVFAYAGIQSHVIPASTAWTNGATMRGWVRVQQAGGLWSEWTQDASTFTVSWTAPTTPTSVTGTNATTPARLSVVSAGSRSGWEVQWYMDEEWQPYAEAVQSAVGSTFYVYVPLAPYGVAVTYRARIFTLNEGQRLYSDWRTSAAFTSTDTGTHLVDDDDHATYFTVRLAGDDRREVLQGTTVTVGHGATSARVDTTDPAGQMGELRFATRTQVEHDALVEWLTGEDVWLVRWAPERDAYGSQTRVDRGYTRMARADRAGMDRIGDGPLSNRHVSVRWVEQ